MNDLMPFASFILMLSVLIAGCQEKDSTHVSNDDSWTLVWSDEFQYDGPPDSDKWTYERGYIRNDELQYYTNRPENVRTENREYLVIEARRDSATVDGETREITSASLTTQGKQTWQYGKVEIRAQVPVGLGTWPALWMLGENISEVPWPLCGEIDIMEHVGYNPDTVFTTVHTQAYNHTIGTQKIAATYLPTADETFHTYGIEWDEQKIDFLIDSTQVFTVKKQSGDTVAEWPFDQPFFLIINFAFGGGWGGLEGVDKASLPQRYVIDYVRVYQRGTNASDT